MWVEADWLEVFDKELTFWIWNFHLWLFAWTLLFQLVCITSGSEGSTWTLQWDKASLLPWTHFSPSKKKHSPGASFPGHLKILSLLKKSNVVLDLEHVLKGRKPKQIIIKPLYCVLLLTLLECVWKRLHECLSCVNPSYRLSSSKATFDIHQLYISDLVP